MTTSRESHSRHSTQALGAIGLVAIALVSALLVATYLKTFKPVVHVTVQADRAGLLLDKGARVRLSGVPVGEVRSTKLQPDGTVRIDVALDEASAGSVPSDVTAAIRATTVFGSKFVDLEVPTRHVKGRTDLRPVASTTPIVAGALVKADDVTIEANDVFAHGMKVLQAVNPSELNSTLTAMSVALEGRGDKFGQFFSDWDSYLTRVDPHLSALESDLKSSATVLRTYADVAPELISTADNVGRTSATLVAHEEQLHDVLVNVVTAASAARTLLLAVRSPLEAFVTQWLPVTALGAEYAPEIGCVIHTLHRHVQIYNPFYGGAGDHTAYVNAGFLPSQEAYTASRNLPKLVSGVGPVCYPEEPSPPHLRFDDGTADIYSDAATHQPVGPSDNPVSLYEDTFRSWFGDSGLNALLEALEKGAKQ
jgi:phospholipid/cholesterol/gamma-HCH transport system substrate-binding protein